MKRFIAVACLGLTIGAAHSCELSSSGDMPKDMVKKLGQAGKSLAPCESLQSVMSMYSKRFVAGGRRIEPVGNGGVDDKSFCKNPKWAKRFAEANQIEDADVRTIVFAAILDDAGQDAARDIVINNPGVNPCRKK